MIDATTSSSTRPYLIRALYEWCADNGLTPFIAVSVDDGVRVPREYVRDGEIVLNVSFEATSALKLGNEFIEFKGRFGGVARDIMVPVSRVLAIYARENGQGMAFPLVGVSPSLQGNGNDPSLLAKAPNLLNAKTTGSPDDPRTPRPNANGRPALTRIK